MTRFSFFASVSFLLLAACGSSGGGNGQTGELRECDAAHPKIGQEAVLSTFAHRVSGTAVIVDDCTVCVDDFVYDRAGVDVRFYRGLGGEYETGFSMSEKDLRRPEGYDGAAAVYAQLPEGRTLDDLDAIDHNLKLSWPIGIMLRPESRRTRGHVELLAAQTGLLNRLSSPER